MFQVQAAARTPRLGRKMGELRPIRFGVINEQIPQPSTWMERARRAEQLGYSTFLLRDHVAPDFFGEQLAPFSALAMAAAVTSSLRVGTMVLGNNYRHPVILAKEAATLDYLSGGRFELGIGAGWLRSEYEQMGLPFDRAGARIHHLEETIEVLRSLFTGAPVHFQGHHHRLNGATCSPLPTQRPGPPLMMGGGHERMLRLAGRLADIVGVMTVSVASGAVEDDPERRRRPAIEQQLGWIRDSAGPRFGSIELSLLPTIIQDADRQRATQTLIEQRGWSGLSKSDVWGMPAIFIGTVNEICEQLLEVRASLGFSYFVISSDRMEALAPIVERLAGT
ncbi:MAG: TIGR03621 family F420-dependent LLM class oxidoreductase [Chloroflexota bacterium]